MIARPHKGQKRLRTGGQPGARHHGARALFQTVYGIAQGKGVFRAQRAVADVAELGVAGLVGVEFLQRGRDDGGGPVHGHVHGTAHAQGRASGMHEYGGILHAIFLRSEE